MKKIIKIIFSLILIILFWISGYFGILKILEIREKIIEQQELKELTEKLLNNSLDLFPTDEEIKKSIIEHKIESEKQEIKRLKATIVYYSKECKNKQNSALWQNKVYGFKMCVPQDYSGYGEFKGRFSGEIFDQTISIGIEKFNNRNDGYFSQIDIDAHKKPFKLEDNNFKGHLFETKTHIVKIEYDKENKEHLEAIKSLKLYDKNKEIILDKSFYEKINDENNLGNSVIEFN